MKVQNVMKRSFPSHEVTWEWLELGITEQNSPLEIARNWQGERFEKGNTVEWPRSTNEVAICVPEVSISKHNSKNYMYVYIKNEERFITWRREKYYRLKDFLIFSENLMQISRQSVIHWLSYWAVKTSSGLWMGSYKRSGHRREERTQWDSGKHIKLTQCSTSEDKEEAMCSGMNL